MTVGHNSGDDRYSQASVERRVKAETPKEVV